MRQGCVLSIVLLVIIGVATSTHGAVYKVIDIAPSLTAYSYPVAINNKGQVLLGVRYSDGNGELYLWSDGEFTNLVEVRWRYPNAVELNDHGQVLGFTSGPGTHPPTVGFIWEKDKGLTEIPNPIDHTLQLIPRGFNNAGQVVGYYETQPGVYPSAQSSFLWERGVFSDMQLFCGQKSHLPGIDNAGVFLCFSGGNYYIGKSPSSMKKLEKADGTAYVAMTNSGNVVGIAADESLFWQGGRVTVLDLFQGYQLYSHSANWAGTVVGNYSLPTPTGSSPRAAIWDSKNRVQDLSSLMEWNTSFSSLHAASDINDMGQIVGTGATWGGPAHPFLATPVRSPRHGSDVVMASPKGAGYLNTVTGAWVQLTDRNTAMAMAGNFDGDSVDDIVCVFPDTQGVQVQNSSTGQWGPLSATNPEWMAVGDMNGDGRDDLVGSWKDAGAVYWRDSVTGAWTSLSATPAKIVAVGNFDGDASGDLVGVWDDNPGVWVLNSSTGQWGRIADTNPKALAVGDMNGDGRDDLIGSWDDSYGVYWRDSVTGAWTKLADSPADMIAVGDLDDDGKADLIGVWPNSSAVLSRLSSTGEWLALYGDTPSFISTGILHR